MLLEGPAGRQWVMIAGLTGKAVLIHDAQELDELFGVLSGERRDAD